MSDELYNELEEPLRTYIQKMGKSLGDPYCRLLVQVLVLNWKWNDFQRLFGESEASVDLLNDTAGDLFSSLQETMHDDIIMRIGRIAESSKGTLTLKQIITLVKQHDRILYDQLLLDWGRLFCMYEKVVKDHRDDRIAHLKMPSPSGESATPVEPVDRRSIQLLISQINETMNEILVRFGFPELGFDKSIEAPLGVSSLLYYLQLGRESHLARSPYGRLSALRPPDGSQPAG